MFTQALCPTMMTASHGASDTRLLSSLTESPAQHSLQVAHLKENKQHAAFLWCVSLDFISDVCYFLKVNGV